MLAVMVYAGRLHIQQRVVAEHGHTIEGERGVCLKIVMALCDVRSLDGKVQHVDEAEKPARFLSGVSYFLAQRVLEIIHHAAVEKSAQLHVHDAFKLIEMKFKHSKPVIKSLL